MGYYYGYAAAVGLFIMSTSLIMMRALRHPDRIAPDTIMAILLIVLALVSLVGLPIGVWAWQKGQRMAADLRMTAGGNSQTDLKLQRHIHAAQMLVALAAGWFIPLAAIGASIETWLSVMIGSVSIGVIIWRYVQMGKLYQQELALMTAADRAAEVKKSADRLRSEWFSTGFLWVVLVITGTLGREISLPPTDPDHWMTLFMIVVATLLLLNQLINTVMYRRWRLLYTGAA
jgi:hypothetical protein